MMEFFDGRAWRDLGFAIMPPNISRLVGYFGRIQFFDMNGTLNMPVWYETRYIKHTILHISHLPQGVSRDHHVFESP